MQFGNTELPNIVSEKGFLGTLATGGACDSDSIQDLLIESGHMVLNIVTPRTGLNLIQSNTMALGTNTSTVMWSKRGPTWMTVDDWAGPM